MTHNLSVKDNFISANKNCWYHRFLHIRLALAAASNVITRFLIRKHLLPLMNHKRVALLTNYKTGHMPGSLRLLAGVSVCVCTLASEELMF